jgi:hypothetical protein
MKTLIVELVLSLDTECLTWTGTYTPEPQPNLAQLKYINKGKNENRT